MTKQYSLGKLVVVLLAAVWVYHSATSDPTPAPDPDASLFSKACYYSKDEVRIRLKSPGSATFPGCEFGAGEYQTRSDPGRHNVWVSGYVDSENFFGAKLRHNWIVHARRTDTGFSTVSVNFQGE